MRRASLSTTLFYLALVFASGALVGVFGNRLYMMKTVSAATVGHRNRAEARRQYIQEMRDRLHLTDGQVTQLQKIAEDTGQRLRDFHKQMEEEHAQKVIAMLSDDQKAEYAKLRQERDQRRQQQK